MPRSAAALTVVDDPGAPGRVDPDLLAALGDVVDLGASDLHITVNAAPTLRIDGMTIAGA